MESNPDAIIEEQLAIRAVELETASSSDLVSLISPIMYGTDEAMRLMVEELAEKRPRLTILLETPGGFIEVAQRIADTLRHHYGHVEFLIPSHAMSAGTVLVMSGDAILMDYYSVLGPIDPQIERPDGRGFVPALGYLEKYNELMEKATAGGLNDAELAYLLQRFDPAELYRYEQEKELSIALLKEWLVKYKFKDWQQTEDRRIPVTSEMKEQRARQIAEELNNTDRWHSHGRGISMSVLQNELKLKIVDFGANTELNQSVRSYYRLLKNYMGVRGHSHCAHSRERFLALS